MRSAERSAARDRICAPTSSVVPDCWDTVTFTPCRARNRPMSAPGRKHQIAGKARGQAVGLLPFGLRLAGDHNVCIACAGAKSGDRVAVPPVPFALDRTVAGRCGAERRPGGAGSSCSSSAASWFGSGLCPVSQCGEPPVLTCINWRPGPRPEDLKFRGERSQPADRRSPHPDDACV